MKSVKIQEYSVYASSVNNIVIDNQKKVVINTINAHSYIVAKKDIEFKKALVNSDILLPDGEGIVLMSKEIVNKKIKKIAGADIHLHLLKLAQENKLKCFYLGASDNTLQLIKDKLSKQYPNINFDFMSPPFKPKFSDDDNKVIFEKINKFKPDVLFVGMTAPKQEKWVHENKKYLHTNIICSIGAVFDFVAETKKRAPKWIINIKLEWLYRSLTAWRLTKRYIYSTPLFLVEIIRLKLRKNN